MSSERPAPDRPRRALGGFTLFEVMAAVLVLGLLYTMLAHVAIRGLRSEGMDRRRGEASLLADRVLTEVEAGLAIGILPELGITETEEPPYRVTIETLAEDVLALLPEEISREERERIDAAGGASALLDSEGESRVRRILVWVEWDEAEQPHRVGRTTFAFDASGLDGALSSPAGTAAEEGADPEGGLGGSGSGDSAGDSSGSGLGSSGGTGSSSREELIEQMKRMLEEAQRR